MTNPGRPRTHSDQSPRAPARARGYAGARERPTADTEKLEDDAVTSDSEEDSDSGTSDDDSSSVATCGAAMDDEWEMPPD